MPGYLDQYGAGEDRRIRIVKTIVISLVSAIALAGMLFYFFHNYREERQAKQFFSYLAAHDYKAAYALFGCTDAHPCSAYEFNKFMEDWGPQSPHPDVAAARIRRSRSCGSGVLLTVEFGKSRPEELWVERKDMSIGYPPFQGLCPALQ